MCVNHVRNYLYTVTDLLWDVPAPLKSNKVWDSCHSICSRKEAGDHVWTDMIPWLTWTHQFLQLQAYSFCFQTQEHKVNPQELFLEEGRRNLRRAVPVTVKMNCLGYRAQFLLQMYYRQSCWVVSSRHRQIKDNPIWVFSVLVWKLRSS